MRFWMAVLGLVIGLQSAIAAHSDGFIQVSEVSAEKTSEVSAEKTSEVSAEKASEVSAEKTSEVSQERERDHSARSLQEMLILFLKGAAALTALVLVYKGLKRWLGPKRQSE